MIKKLHLQKMHPLQNLPLHSNPHCIKSVSNYHLNSTMKYTHHFSTQALYQMHLQRKVYYCYHQIQKYSLYFLEHGSKFCFQSGIAKPNLHYQLQLQYHYQWRFGLNDLEFESKHWYLQLQKHHLSSKYFTSYLFPRLLLQHLQKHILGVLLICAKSN